MSKKSLFAHQIAALTVRNAIYRRFLLAQLDLVFRADLGSGDLTTALLIHPRRAIKAAIRAKQAGVIAGLEEIQTWLKTKNVKLLARVKDGARVEPGQIVCQLTGTAEAVLTTERTALNLLQRLSGIATATAQLIQQVGSGKIAATRKTPLGLLDCRAVVLGGGLPHRLSLADQILVKENHIKVDPDCWRKIRTTRPFEIEADSSELALQIAQHYQGKPNLILMLDNFTPAKLKRLVPQLRQLNPQITLEASGGITPPRVKDFLDSGVDFVSLGWLTHSTPVLDLSLKVSN